MAHRRGPLLAATTAAAALALGVGWAAAQERAPPAREQLAQLAHVLGESHALRQACAGADDQYWRSRMQSLLDVEASDERLRKRLAEAFNAGYGAAQALYPSCTAAARQQSQRLARTGRALANALAAP